ncbi:MAG TPA: hypothetical protein VFE78_33330 [Gemmataceae bacterium]|nr:hypothetical protein [Gemmataceae bacterium]
MILRPWPRSLSPRTVCLLAAAAATLVAVALAAGPRHREPETVAEFLQRLRAAGIDWQVTPVMNGGGPEHGAYLCDRPRRWEELQFLTRRHDQAPRWRGVVLVDRHPSGPLRSEWGECGLAVGGLSLFGDREMLRQILTTLRQ